MSIWPKTTPSGLAHGRSCRSSIAEYERDLVRERTALKLEHARKSGRKFGRPAKLNADKAALARMEANGETAATICATLGIGRTNK